VPAWNETDGFMYERQGRPTQQAVRIKPIPIRQFILSSFLGDDKRWIKLSYSRQICITSASTRNGGMHYRF